MRTRTVAMAIAATVSIAACSAQTDQPPQPRPQQAGEPMDPLRTAGHMAMNEDMRRAMKLADATRPIDQEAARAIALSMPGVRSANWIDRHNLLVRVEGAQLRSQRTIDALCLQLESLGDTLAVVVHVQDAAHSSYDGMDTLSHGPGMTVLIDRITRRAHDTSIANA